MTRERSVARDGLADPEPELDELVWCVGAAGGGEGGVDAVPELLWVPEVTATLAEVDWAGVYLATTTR